MPMFNYYIIQLLILGAFIHSSWACNGYSIQVHHIINCDPNSLIKLSNNNVSLDENCIVHSTGCGEITKPFKTMKVTYSLKKPPMPTFEGEKDACALLSTLDNPTILNALATFNIPNKCPVAAGKICSSPDKTLDISKFKNHLGMAAGKSDIRLEIVHDTGKSCIEISSTIAKAKRTG